MNSLNKIVKESDVIIYNLDESNPDEIEMIIKVLKYAEYMSPKILILVSTILTWSRNNIDPPSSET